MGQDDLSGKKHAIICQSRFRVRGSLFMISHSTLAKLLEIDLLPINVQGFSDAPGFI